MFRNIFKTRQMINFVRTRYYSDGTPASSQLTDGEKQILGVLKSKFPNANEINVSDISGGCGAMFEIQIESEDFRGKKTVMQHRMVTEALKEEIKEMHGLRINTQVPS